MKKVGVIIKNILNLTKKDYPEIFKLSEYAFQYELDKEAFDKKCLEAERHKIYGIKLEDKLAGKLHMIPLEVYIQGRLFTMGGISSVATWPEYSGKRIAEKLIKRSLTDLQDEHITLAYLHPFNAGFYRRFGFEFAFDSIDYIVPVEKLRHSWEKLGSIQRDDVKLSELNQVYETFVQRFNGGLKRDEKWWKQRVLTDDQAEMILLKDDNENPQAYLIYKLQNSRLEVLEMAYTNQAYKESIYHFIMKHQATITDVKLPTYESDLLSYIVSDPTFNQEKQPYFMARIVDVENFLKEYPFEIKNDSFINLFVTDDFLMSNTGLYKISATEVFKTDNIESTDYLAINISDLTALLMGYKTVEDLKALNKIQGSDDGLNKLDSLLNLQPTYLLDYF